jgi:hypothetical protein
MLKNNSNISNSNNSTINIINHSTNNTNLTHGTIRHEVTETFTCRVAISKWAMEWILPNTIDTMQPLLITLIRQHQQA